MTAGDANLFLFETNAGAIYDVLNEAEAVSIAAHPCQKDRFRGTEIQQCFAQQTVNQRLLIVSTLSFMLIKALGFALKAMNPFEFLYF